MIMGATRSAPDAMRSRALTFPAILEDLTAIVEQTSIFAPGISVKVSRDHHEVTKSTD